jgi:hypothetical protein
MHQRNDHFAGHQLADRLLHRGSTNAGLPRIAKTVWLPLGLGDLLCKFLCRARR